MTDQPPTLGALASVFQLTAGIALAMSVFRAPYEHFYHRLGMILDREERLLAGPTNALSEEHIERVLSARMSWLVKGREMEPGIAQRERWIKGAIFLSAVLLVIACLWPNTTVSRLFGLFLMLLVGAPLFWGWISIEVYVRDNLSHVRREVEELSR